MLGMSSAHLAFHIVNRGIFSGIMSNKGKWEHLFETRNSVCLLLIVKAIPALYAASFISICPIVFKDDVI